MYYNKHTLFTDILTCQVGKVRFKKMKLGDYHDILVQSTYVPPNRAGVSIRNTGGQRAKLPLGNIMLPLISLEEGRKLPPSFR